MYVRYNLCCDVTILQRRTLSVRLSNASINDCNRQMPGHRQCGKAIRQKYFNHLSAFKYVLKKSSIGVIGMILSRRFHRMFFKCFMCFFVKLILKNTLSSSYCLTLTMWEFCCPRRRLPKNAVVYLFLTIRYFQTRQVLLLSTRPPFLRSTTWYYSWRSVFNWFADSNIDFSLLIVCPNHWILCMFTWLIM